MLPLHQRFGKPEKRRCGASFRTYRRRRKRRVSHGVIAMNDGESDLIYLPGFTFPAEVPGFPARPRR
jgi:hypothetical protein